MKRLATRTPQLATNAKNGSNMKNCKHRRAAAKRNRRKTA